MHIKQRQLHVVHEGNRDRYRDEILQHHQLRHRIYIKGHGWTHLEKSPGIEADSFDTPRTIYLLSVEDGKVVGGSRLNSTLEPTLTSDVFPQLCNKRMPVGPSVWDWSRFHVDPDRRDGGGISPIAAELYCGVMEFALCLGATELTFVGYSTWMNRFPTVGWKIEFLGDLEPCDGDFIFAGSLTVSEEALESARVALSVTHSNLHQSATDEAIAHAFESPPNG